MQINVIDDSPEQSEARRQNLMRKLRSLMARIQALQALFSIEDSGDNDVETMNNIDSFSVLDVETMRQGLHDLEQMAGQILYEVQEADGELSLAEWPGASFGEALSQLVDTTAESFALSSRVVFSGLERPLPDYLSRLLYRIAQETLLRVSTHEGARRLRFSMDYRRTEVVMTIEDDGVPGIEEHFPSGEPGEGATPLPFLAESQAEKKGTPEPAEQTMSRLRDMVEALGGSLVIKSGIEQGVQVHVHAPLQRSEREIHERADIIASTALAGRDVDTVITSSAGQRTTATLTTIRILIVDGQTVLRAGLRHLLEHYPDLEVVGEAGNGVQAVSETVELLPQVVLLDAQLPENQSLDTLRQIRQLNKDIHVLLLAGQEDETALYDALKAGAGGYILKDIAPDELARTIRGVAHGDVLIQPQLAARLLTRSGNSERGTGLPQESLTAREREVLHLLARGLRNKEIAARLFVSERTVNFHLANIYAKLRVSGRTEALSKALEQGLLKA